MLQLTTALIRNNASYIVPADAGLKKAGDDAMVAAAAAGDDGIQQSERDCGDDEQRSDDGLRGDGNAGWCCRPDERAGRWLIRQERLRWPSSGLRPTRRSLCPATSIFDMNNNTI